MTVRVIAAIGLLALLAAPWAALAGDNDPIAGLAPGTPVALQRLAQMQPNDMVIIIGKIGRPWPDDFPAQLAIVRRHPDVFGNVTIVQGEVVRLHPSHVPCVDSDNSHCNGSLEWIPGTDGSMTTYVDPALVDDLYWDLGTLWPLTSWGTICVGDPPTQVTRVIPGLRRLIVTWPLIREVNPTIVLWGGQVSGCILGEPHTYAFQVNLHILRADIDGYLDMKGI
jgi:hypothetical protein